MASEKRLVNAEAIARKLKYAHCSDCHVVRQIQCSACWVGDVLELLEGDTVDAVEVVHGRWILKETCGANTEKYHCSVCNKIPKSLCTEYYCPNCGAKMDGDGNG